jgi:hypothetical protein
MSNTSLIHYKPNDHEAEKASNSYLMSVIAIMVGLPLPIINLIATLFFFLGNRKGSLFIKWHCTQALLSQALIVIMNSVGFSWTMTILFGDNEVTNLYLGYIITIFLFNLFEFIVTVRAAVVIRKGKHLNFWLFGPITDLIYNIEESPVNNYSPSSNAQ